MEIKLLGASKVEIGKLIGRGGMGEIYEATLIGTGNIRRRVAAKKLSSPDISEESIREASILSSLKHPNICQFYDIEKNEDEYFMIIEFIDGITLDDVFEYFLKDKTIPDEKFLNSILCQLLRGINYLHNGLPANKIIHGDLSPSNVMIDSNGTLKILDFGISRILEKDKENTKTESFKGKLTYSAPEGLYDGTYSEKTDLYAIGVIIYELATIVRLFAASEIPKVLANVKLVIPENLKQLRPDLSEEFCGIIMKLIDKRPENRPQANEIYEREQFARINPEYILKNDIGKWRRIKPAIQNTVTSAGGLISSSRRKSIKRNGVIGLIFLLLTCGAIFVLVKGSGSTLVIDEIQFTTSDGKVISKKIIEADLITQSGSKSDFSRLSCAHICQQTDSSYTWAFTKEEAKTNLENLIRKKDPKDLEGFDYYRYYQDNYKFRMDRITEIMSKCDTTFVCGLAKESLTKMIQNVDSQLGRSNAPLKTIDTTSIEASTRKVDEEFIRQFGSELGKHKGLMDVGGQLSNNIRSSQGIIISSDPFDEFPSKPEECRTVGDFQWFDFGYKSFDDKLMIKKTDLIAVLMLPKGFNPLDIEIDRNSSPLVKVRIRAKQNVPPFCYYERKGFDLVRFSYFPGNQQ